MVETSVRGSLKLHIKVVVSMASSLRGDFLTGQDVQWLRHGCISDNHMFSLLQLFATKVQLTPCG